MIQLLALITFFGRHDSILYQAETDPSWHLLPREENLQDTTKPIASFLIENDLLVTIHNFPFISFENSVPPQAQVQRWQKQLNLEDSSITPTTHGGFIGLILESETLIAAAFQLAPIHQKKQKNPLLEYTADWTIKAKGPASLIQKYRLDLLKLIHTFELVDDL